MALYHCSVKTVSRSNGHSATAASSYRSGEQITDQRTGEIHDYTRRGGVVCTTMFLPDGVEPMTRAELWNLAEGAENRKNSTVARECEVSLPHELDRKTQIAMADEFGAWLVARHGFAADVSIHEPTEKNDERNTHAHILMTTRRMDSNGDLGEKCRELDAAKTGSVEILAWRKHWATICNRELEAGGHAARVDHRSHVERGLEDLPTVHVGNGPRSQENAAANAEAVALNAEIREALAERATLVAAATIAEATAKARQVVTDQDETEAAPVVSVPGRDIAAAPLTPAQINAVKRGAPVAPVPVAAVHAREKAKLTTLAAKVKIASAKHLQAYDVHQRALSEQRRAGESLWSTFKAIFKVPTWKRLAKDEIEALRALKSLQARYDVQSIIEQKARPVVVAPAPAPMATPQTLEQQQQELQRLHMLHIATHPMLHSSNGQRQRLDVPKG